MNTSPKRRIALAAGSAVALTALLAGCSAGGGSEGEGSGGTLVFAVETDPSCIDPQQPTVTQALYIGRQVVDSLVDQDPETGEIVPWLASEFSSNDDMTAFEFTLRDDVTFSDGSELTSEVVQANFDAIVEMAADGSTASLAGQYLSGYAGTEIVDDQTFRVAFDAPNAAFLQGASTMSLGLVSQATTEETPEARCQDGVIGTGPFVYDAYAPNSEVSMDRRDGYDWASGLRGHEGDAYLDRIEFAVVTEASVRVGGLQSGEFDIVGELPYADEPRIADEGYSIYAKANPGIPTSLIPNLENPVLADPAVREALRVGIDREDINATLGYAGGEAPTSALSSGTSGYTSQAGLMAYDPDAAIAALEDAGWAEGADGIREKDGQRLTFTATGFYEQEMMELIQLQLKDLGIDMQIDFTDAGGFFGAIADRSYDVLFAALTRTGPDALGVMFEQAAPSHWAVVDDAELEAILSEQAATSDEDARQELLDEAQRIIIEDGYLFPVLEVYQVHASQPEVTGFAFDSASRFHLYDVELG
ncbi:ABC transporter substrate-binding protein [Microbacterium betulae]|uniref:ABC transporter substrate-binding protein n=1 Tax=Microbacterium betulae TaxID=2981139 RepID=A0AA97FJ75_9MICO|nr:ABC transporter substrate-binding protein [Microbacterium sp. AB]WOF23019.1 ABC transporter substrate-binding protein [Microbacterium sp. AB]